MNPASLQMLEQLSGPVVTLITDLPHPAMAALLTWLHQGRLPQRCDPLLASLIAAARKYNFPNLKRAAEKRLLSLGPDDGAEARQCQSNDEAYHRMTTSPPSSDDGGSDSQGLSPEGRPSSCKKKKRAGQPSLLVTLPPKKRRRYSSSSSVDSGYTSDQSWTPQ